MLKMKNILTESKYLTRKFGDPLPTFNDVMKQHIESKLDEDLDAVGNEDDDVDNDGDSDASDDYLKNRRDVISKAIEKESVKDGGTPKSNQLNQETLTIDGKQFRRISEDVEKEPKYKFAELHDRLINRRI